MIKRLVNALTTRSRILFKLAIRSAGHLRPIVKTVQGLPS